MAEITRKTIIEIGMSNPIAHNILRGWACGEYDWEKAMMYIVVLLDEEFQRNRLKLDLKIMQEVK